MILRYAAIAGVAGVAVLAAGCSNNPAAVMGYQSSGMLVSPAVAEEAQQPTEAQMAQKTLAGKVLTAIALERVTGRKPDPARFSELY